MSTDLMRQIENAIRVTVQEHLNLADEIGPPDAEDIAHDAGLKIAGILAGPSS